ANGQPQEIAVTTPPLPQQATPRSRPSDGLGQTRRPFPTSIGLRPGRIGQLLLEPIDLAREHTGRGPPLPPDPKALVDPRRQHHPLPPAPRADPTPWDRRSPRRPPGHGPRLGFQPAAATSSPRPAQPRPAPPRPRPRHRP